MGRLLLIVSHGIGAIADDFDFFGLSGVVEHVGQESATGGARVGGRGREPSRRGTEQQLPVS